MSIWNLYRRPKSFEGEQVDGYNARYFTAYELADKYPVASQEYFGIMASYYLVGVCTYIICTKNGMKAQRFFSSLIIAAVPLITLGHLKGDDSNLGNLQVKSLESKLDFYPSTRRALERAIQDVSNNN